MAAGGSFERALGQIEGTLKALVESVAVQGRQSSEARGKMYDAIAEVRTLQQDMDFRLEQLEKRVADITPETREFTQWRYRAQGAGMLGRWLWVAGGMVLSAAAGVAGAWHWLVGKGP